MSEQPKFQRRKRRGPVTPAPRPSENVTPIAETQSPDVKAMLAERDALLQRKAELEARRAASDGPTDQTPDPAEGAHAPLTLEEDARITDPVDALAKEPTARRAEAEATPAPDASPKAEEDVAKTPVSKPETAVEQPKPIKPSQPLVLASAPRPKPRLIKAPHNPSAVWDRIDRFELDPRQLAARNIVTALREDPAHTRFDILRTRMLQALVENGWKRIAITSPTKDCGKTFTAANLAISLSRQENCNTVLLDLDMRNPSLHKVFDIQDPGAIGDLLRGNIRAERHLQGFAPNALSIGSRVAIGFNGVVEPYAAELLQDPSTEDTLKQIEFQLEPDVMLFDLPPALLNDDVLAMRPHFDALLLVAAGGTTRAQELKETERRLGESVPLLGVILNKAEQADTGDYAY